MRLRASVEGFTCRDADFARLCARVAAGGMRPEDNRLPTRPAPLEATDVLDLTSDAERREARIARGRAALAAGKVAMAVLNGGMAMRFGGGAKGAVELFEDREDTFLSVKLAQVSRCARAHEATIPTVVMHSFATEATCRAHLDEVNWSGLPSEARKTVVQSILPRVHPDGRALHDDPALGELPDTSVYAAPGHGDFLPTMRDSGAVAWLRDRGVEHVLMSNVDNLGASLDPEVVGAHLEAVEQGARVSVEAVARAGGDRGGCIARIGERGEIPAIVEGFRLPEGVDVADYPLFNTNTLWFTLEALATPAALQWFAVHRALSLPGDHELPIIQFEQLVGQITEFLPSRYLVVERDRRFLPVKTRADLERMTPMLRGLIDATT